MWLRVAAYAAELVVPVAHAQARTAPFFTPLLDDAIALSGKINCRQALVFSNIETLTPKREIKRLNLLAENARRYIAVATEVAQEVVLTAPVVLVSDVLHSGAIRPEIFGVIEPSIDIHDKTFQVKHASRKSEVCYV